jgi:hypothetical protein
MSEKVALVSPDGEVQHVEARPDVLVPLMIRGYRQLSEREEVKPDVRDADAGTSDLLR